MRQALALPADLVHGALAKRLYVDLRTSEKQRANFPSLVNRIDSEVRRLRAARRFQAAAGKVAAVRAFSQPSTTASLSHSHDVTS